MKLISLFSLTVICSLSFSQSSTIIWQNSIGGTANDNLTTVSPTSDGGYIIGGHSRSNASGDKSEALMGTIDYWVVKTDDQGVIEWENALGGDDYEQFGSVLQLSDGSYFVGGESMSNASGDKTEDRDGPANTGDLWLLRLNSAGDVIWDHTYGGTNEEFYADAIELPNGNIIVAGTSGSGSSPDKTEASKGAYDFWIMELDSANGDIIWDQTIGGSDNDFIRSIDLDASGNILIGGQSDSDISSDKTEYSYGSRDYWIVKISATGATIWDKTIGGATYEILGEIQHTTDGGMIVAGNSDSPVSGLKDETCTGCDTGAINRDYWVVKLDELGDIEWQKTLGSLEDEEFQVSIIETLDGGYVVGGSSESNVSGDKTDAGYNGTDYWLIKLDVNGSYVWDKAIGGTNHDDLWDMFELPSGNVILGGSSRSALNGDKTENTKGQDDYWVMEFSPGSLNLDPATSFEFNIFPNPTQNIVTIVTAGNLNPVEILICDIEGRVLNCPIKESSAGYLLDLSDLESGVYLIRAKDQTVKVLKR